MGVTPNSNIRTVIGGEKADRVTIVMPDGESVPVEIVTGGSNIEFDLADGTVSAIKAIYKTINGISHADKDTTSNEATVIGVSITGNTNGNQVKYQIIGRLEDSSFNFPLNDPLYLGNSGAITNVAPITGFRTKIGTSLGTGAIQINIEEPIEL